MDCRTEQAKFTESCAHYQKGDRFENTKQQEQQIVDTEEPAIIDPTTSTKETPDQMLEVHSMFDDITIQRKAPAKKVNDLGMEMEQLRRGQQTRLSKNAVQSSLNMTKAPEKGEEADYSSFRRRVLQAVQNELAAQRKSFDNQITCLDTGLKALREEQQIMKREHENTKTALEKTTSDLGGLHQIHNKAVEELGNRMGQLEQELAQQKADCKAGLLKQLDYLRQLAQVIAGVEDSSSSDKRKRNSAQEGKEDSKRQCN